MLTHLLQFHFKWIEYVNVLAMIFLLTTELPNFLNSKQLSALSFSLNFCHRSNKSLDKNPSSF